MKGSVLEHLIKCGKYMPDIAIFVKVLVETFTLVKPNNSEFKSLKFLDKASASQPMLLLPHYGPKIDKFCGTRQL